MYSIQEENELIRQAKEGQQTACQQLLSAYAGLFKNVERRYRYTPTGKIIADDVLGILYLAFMEALHDFDPDRNIHFAAFLQIRLHGAIYKAFQQACKYNQRTTHPIIESDAHQDFFDLQESPQPTPERKVLAREELAAILRQLNQPEKELLHLLYREQLPQKAIAQVLHLSPQAVSKRKQNLIAKIKKLA